MAPSDPMFRGKRESEWVDRLNHGIDTADSWPASDPEGIQFLGRALERRRSAGARAYHRLETWSQYRFPRAVARLLPSREDDFEMQIVLLYILRERGTNALPAEPFIGRGLRDPYFANHALLCYPALLTVMSAEAKNKRLPDFLWTLNEAPQEWGTRSYAAGALRYYPSQRATVVPALTNAWVNADAELKTEILKTLRVIAPDEAAQLRSE